VEVVVGVVVVLVEVDVLVEVLVDVDVAEMFSHVMAIEIINNLYFC